VYVFVRTDLTLPQQTVQACHAAIEAARHSFFLPADEHPHLVLCGIRSEVALQGVMLRLRRQSIRHQPFYEPDFGGQLTAICTEPLRDERRRGLRGYTLLRGPPSFYP
jgi:hypothetical protein